MNRSATDQKTELIVFGMTCQNCVRHVTEALRSVPGVQSAVTELEGGTASVRWEPGSTPNEAALLAALNAAGYGGKIRSGSAREAPASQRPLLSGWRFNVALGVAVTVPLMILEWGFGAGAQRWYHWLSFALVLPLQVLGGFRFYVGAWKQLKAGHSNMDTLVALGSTTAFVYSVWGLLAGWRQHLYFMDAAAILTLISLGHFLESRATAQAASSLRALLKLAPEMARRLRPGGGEETVAVTELRVGDQVRLRAGDQVPTDGEVVEGTSSVNEAMLTGESMPVTKAPGEKVYAGTINENGTLTVRVTATGDDTALARIIQIVRQAQTSRANIQRLGDRVSGIFVPIVIFVAAATAAWWLFAPETATRVHSILERFLWHGHIPETPVAAAVYHAAAVLIIACPCAMGLATPVAIMAGTNAAARRGILIRDGVALEKSGSITAVLFDKTGTLTVGKVAVAAVECFSPDARALAGALARHSRHPLSRAIAESAPGNEPFEEIREIRGAGIQAWKNNEEYRLGSLRFLEANQVDLSPAGGFSEHWTSNGASVTGLARGKTLLAVFALTDSPKPRAREVVQGLMRQGLSVYLVTGDHRRTAEAVARQIGIPLSNVRAEATPEAKIELIQSLRREGHRVAFAGDGINDAPALEASDLGIAMMSASDVARESADLVLLKADLDAIPEALALARATLRAIKQNLFWAFFYNAAGVPLAAFGFVSPIFSAFAMGMSDLIVIGNALRLRFRKWRVGRE